MRIGRAGAFIVLVWPALTCNAITGAGDLEFVLGGGGESGDGGVDVPGFTLSLEPPSATVDQGDHVSIAVQVERRGGFVGPIIVTVSDLPPNVDATPLTIENDAVSGTFMLSADATAEQGSQKARVVGVTGALSESVDLDVLVRGPPGALDTTFGSNGIAMAEMDGGGVEARGFALSDDGAIVVAGTAVGEAVAIRRFLPDGGIDANFGEGGLAVSAAGNSRTVWSLAARSDGKIAPVGYSTVGGESAILVYRVLSDGRPDDAFGQGGFVEMVPSAAQSSWAGRGAAFQSAGRTVVAVDGSAFAALLRVDDAGAPDPSFGSGGIVQLPLAEAQAVHVRSDGEIVVSGSQYVDGGSKLAVVRLTADGALDPSFGQAGVLVTGTTGSFPPMAVGADGSVLLCRSYGAGLDVVRVTPTGQLDGSFGTDGVVSVSGNFALNGVTAASGVAFQDDGKVIGAGGAMGFIVARWTSEGVADSAFGSAGKTEIPVAGFDRFVGAALQKDGRIVVGGSANGKFVVARFWP